MINLVSQLIPFMPPYKIGYAPRMVSDVKRNQFYDTLLQQCQGKVCSDVGFGTGLLTLMALHYGAKHVYAFEQDFSVFNLGKAIITELGYSDKVTFINERYSPKFNEDVVFHEIVDRSLWGEDIASVKFPQNAKILPSNVSCRIHFISNSSAYIKPKDNFNNTGIPYLDASFNSAMKNILDSKEYQCYDDIDKTTLKSDGILNQYSIDLKSDIPNELRLDIDVPIDDCIIWCENFIDDFRLMDGHWRSDKVIHKLYKGKCTFVQNTQNGSWWIE